MYDLVNHPLNVGEWLGILTLVAIVCSSAIAIVAIVTDHTRRSRLDDMKATIKMEMLQRGMSADDIAKVLQNPDRQLDREMAAQASGHARSSHGHWRHRPAQNG